MRVTVNGVEIPHDSDTVVAIEIDGVPVTGLDLMYADPEGAGLDVSDGDRAYHHYVIGHWDDEGEWVRDRYIPVSWVETSPMPGVLR